MRPSNDSLLRSSASTASRASSPHRRSGWSALGFVQALLLTIGPSLATGADDDPVLAGRVLDGLGAPVGGAHVLLRPWSDPCIGDREEPVGASSPTMTDDGGRFLVRRRELGEVGERTENRLRAWARKGEVTSRRSVVRPGSAEALDLRFVLRESLDARVTVERDDGSRIAGADLTLDLSDLAAAPGDLAGHYRIAVKTDVKGEARLFGLPEGKYGDAHARIQVAERAFGIAQEGIALEHQGKSLRVRIVAPAVVRVTGVLLERDGSPAVGLRVVESGADRPSERFVTADESGRFALPNVPCTARALLVCSKPPAERVDGFAGHVAARWPSVIEVVPLHLSRTGGPTDLGALRLPERRTLRVRVTDGAQNPVRSRVMLQRVDAWFGAASRPVDAAGWVEFEDVSRTGPYRIEVRADSPTQGEVEQHFPVAPEVDAQTVRLTGAGMLIVRFFSSAKPEQRVRLDAPSIVWIGSAGRSMTEMREMEEVRMWVGAGESGKVQVLTSGTPRAMSETISTRADAPTVVDVVVKGP